MNEHAHDNHIERFSDIEANDVESVANLRNRNMELEAALAVTTESLNKANYEKYLLERNVQRITDFVEIYIKNIREAKDNAEGDRLFAQLASQERAIMAVLEEIKRNQPTASEHKQKIEEEQS